MNRVGEIAETEEPPEGEERAVLTKGEGGRVSLGK